MTDQSRKRSLYFLLMATARPLVLSSSDILVARQIVQNLEIEELKDSWKIVSLSEGRILSLEVDKNEFSFYNTRNQASYPIDPGIRNKSSAERVVSALFRQTSLDGKTFSLDLKPPRRVLPVPLICIFFLWISNLWNSFEPTQTIYGNLVLGAVVAYATHIFVAQVRYKKYLSTLIFLVSSGILIGSKGYSGNIAPHLFVSWILVAESASYFNFPKKQAWRNWLLLTIALIMIVVIFASPIKKQELIWGAMFMAALLFLQVLHLQGHEMIRFLLLLFSFVSTGTLMAVLLFFSPGTLPRAGIGLIVSLALSIQGYRASAARIFSGLLLMSA